MAPLSGRSTRRLTRRRRDGASRPDPFSGSPVLLFAEPSGRDAGRNLDSPLAFFVGRRRFVTVDRSVQRAEILRRQARNSPRVVQHSLRGLFVDFLLQEPLQLRLAHIALKTPDAFEDGVPTLRMAGVTFERRLVPLNFAIFLRPAERFVREGIVERAAQRNNMFDVDRRFVAQKEFGGNRLAGIRTNAVAFFPKSPF